MHGGKRVYEGFHGSTDIEKIFDDASARIDLD